MQKIEIKVCGLTSVDQINELTDVGVDYCGLIFYNKSPRCADGKIDGKKLKDISIHSKLTGVFVNEEVERIKNKINEYGLSAVQLCGNETPDQCQQLKSFARVIKVIPMDLIAPLSPVHEYQNKCDLLLFDTASKLHGGTGIKFNWNSIHGLKILQPFFLSGGIGPDDIQNVKRFNHKYFEGIDLNSRFEIAPGVKDIEKIKKFLNELKYVQI